MSKNKLIIAAAGSGKTTYLVKEALRCPRKNVLITTYTQSNEASIKKAILTPLPEPNRFRRLIFGAGEILRGEGG